MNTDATSSESVWLVEEIYDTGAGPSATRPKEIFAKKRDAFVYVASLVAELLEYEKSNHADHVAEIMDTCKRLHWWEGGGVRFHGRMGPNHEVYGYLIAQMPLRKTTLARQSDACPFCHHIGPLVEGRDPGLMACAECGAQ